MASPRRRRHAPQDSRGHGHGTAGGLDRVRRRGTYDRAGHNILIANDAEGFAAHVLALLGSAGRAALLGQAGRELVEARYRWNTCLAGLDCLYERLLGPRAA